jgi:predicted Zn-dependent protease
MFLREHKRLEEAETYLKIGAEAVLQNTQAWETLAVVQYQLEMYKDAVATWKTILMRFPKNPTIWMSVANTQANKLNQREQAASSYAKVAAFSGPQTQLGHQARQWLQQHGAGNGGGGA